MKSVLFLRKNCMLEDIMDVLSRKGLFTHHREHFRINRKRNADIFIATVLTSPKLLEGFKQYLHDRGIYYILKMIDLQSVTLNDKTVLSELEGSMTGKCLRPNGGKPLIKFTSQQRDFLLRELENANDIAASLLSKMIISGNEFLKISLQHARRMGITVLLDILEKCSENHLVDFYFALKENGYNPSTEEFAGINQLISKKKDSRKEVYPSEKKGQHIKATYTQLGEPALQQDKYQQHSISKGIVDDSVFHMIHISNEIEKDGRKKVVHTEKKGQHIKATQLGKPALQQDKYQRSITKESVLEAEETKQDIRQRDKHIDKCTLQ